jgi:hypothetical protein
LKLIDVLRCVEAVPFAPHLIDQEFDSICIEQKHKRSTHQSPERPDVFIQSSISNWNVSTASKHAIERGHVADEVGDKPKQLECAGEARCRSAFLDAPLDYV